MISRNTYIKPPIVLDLETSDRGTKKAKIIQIAMRHMFYNLQVRLYSTYVNLDPGSPISKYAERVHGISKVFLQNSPHFNDIAGDIAAFINGRLIVGHNIVRFDLKILERQLMEAANFRKKIVVYSKDTLNKCRREHKRIHGGKKISSPEQKKQVIRPGRIIIPEQLTSSSPEVLSGQMINSENENSDVTPGLLPILFGGNTPPSARKVFSENNCRRNSTKARKLGPSMALQEIARRNGIENMESLHNVVKINGINIRQECQKNKTPPRCRRAHDALVDTAQNQVLINLIQGDSPINGVSDKNPYFSSTFTRRNRLN